jgi:hypothetical protein
MFIFKKFMAMCPCYFSANATYLSNIFVVLQHVYIPIIFSSGVDYIDAPTPYMMGLHSGVDTSTVTMDGVSLKTKMLFPLANL